MYTEQQKGRSIERMLHIRTRLYLLRARAYRGGLVANKSLPNMASEEKKSVGKMALQTESKAELKKHRGIPEALFLVSIYHRFLCNVT